MWSASPPPAAVSCYTTTPQRPTTGRRPRTPWTGIPPPGTTPPPRPPGTVSPPYRGSNGSGASSQQLGGGSSSYATAGGAQQAQVGHATGRYPDGVPLDAVAPPAGGGPLPGPPLWVDGLLAGGA